MPRWEILYADGSWFTSNDGAYWQAPRVGVQVVLQEHPKVGVEVVQSADGWWIWLDGAWFGCDREGKDDYLRHHESPEICVLQGRWVPHDQWEEVLERVRMRKSAWFSHELAGAPV